MEDVRNATIHPCGYNQIPLAFYLLVHCCKHAFPEICYFLLEQVLPKLFKSTSLYKPHTPPLDWGCPFFFHHLSHTCTSSSLHHYVPVQDHRYPSTAALNPSPHCSHSLPHSHHHLYNTTPSLKHTHGPIKIMGLATSPPPSFNPNMNFRPISCFTK